MSSKSLAEKIIDIILKSVYQYYCLNCCNNEKAITQTQIIFDQTGFVSLDIENSRAFIYALHPTKFIKDNNLWNFVQNNIEKEYAITLCIGLFEVGKPQGTQFSKKFEDISLDLKKDFNYMEFEIKTVADLESACQLAANAGLAIHAIEVSTECGHCASDIVLDNPVLSIIKSDKGSVKLLFRNGD